MGVKKFAGEITNVQCKSQHASRKESDSGQQNSADLYYSQRCTSASSCAIKHDIFLKKKWEDRSCVTYTLEDIFYQRRL